MRPAAVLSLLAVLLLTSPAGAGAGDAKLPSAKALRAIVTKYLDGDYQTRLNMREEADATYAPLKASAVKKLRADLLKYARKTGPAIENFRDPLFLCGQGRQVHRLGEAIGHSLRRPPRRW